MAGERPFDHVVRPKIVESEIVVLTNSQEGVVRTEGECSSWHRFLDHLVTGNIPYDHASRVTAISICAGGKQLSVR
jgi:hypothetical protein